MGRSVFIAAGGTGGHTYPALAISEEFRKRRIDIYWIGSTSGMERGIVSKKKIRYLGLPVSGYRYKNLFKMITSIFFAIISTIISIFLILKIRPKLILGMGGYVSGPIGLAAVLSRTKLVIHEQNAIPGFTNKILFRFAQKVFEGFPGTFKHEDTIYSGSPVRKEIWLANKKLYKKNNSLLNILIVGGSSGARFFNIFLPQVIKKICIERKVSVLHQTGLRDFVSTQKLYENLRLREYVKVVPYIDAMDQAYIEHDLLLSRAGASTVSEILAVGINSILIPFPFSVDSHQVYNAQFLAEQGGCHIILEKDCTLEGVVALVNKVGFNEQIKERVISITSSIAIPNSASIIVDSCMEFFDA